MGTFPQQILVAVVWTLLGSGATGIISLITLGNRVTAVEVRSEYIAHRLDSIDSKIDLAIHQEKPKGDK
jgi:hypothetical protein